jgi:hypothetical protein
MRWRTLSLTALIISLILGLLTIAFLVIGIVRSGAGHGDSTVFSIGIVLWFGVWAVLGVSVVADAVAWAKTRTMSLWFVPASSLFLFVSLAGLWGLQG